MRPEGADEANEALRTRSDEANVRYHRNNLDQFYNVVSISCTHSKRTNLWIEWVTVVECDKKVIRFLLCGLY